MPRESPTDFLIRALENVEGAEDVLIVFRKKRDDGTDDIDWLANNVPLWKLLGMMEFCKIDMYKQAEGDEDNER